MSRFRALCCWFVAVLLVLAWPVPASVSAQQSAVPPSSGAPRFEAATIKPSPANSEYGLTSVWEFVPNGDVMVRNAPLRLVIALAYQIDTQYQTVLLVGSDDLLGQRFDIQGKAPAQVQRSDGSARLRALLEERFALRTHVETREIPIYALVRTRTDRLGPDLQPSALDCAVSFDPRTAPQDSPLRASCSATRRDSQKMRVAGSGKLTELVRYLKQFLDRPLRDATGLDGLHQWDVTFSVNRNPAADSEFPPMETAIQERLGLRIVPRTGPMDVRVIDSVRAPTEN